MSADGSRTAYQAGLGIQIDRGADGGARAEIPYDGKLTNPFSVVNGGVIASLITWRAGPPSARRWAGRAG